MKKVDAVIKLIIFSIFDGALQTFRPQRRIPSKKFTSGEDLDQTALKISAFTTLDYKNAYFEQLYTFTSERGNTDIEIVYYLLYPGREVKSTEKDNWERVNRIDRHDSDREVINYAVQRLKWKVEYTNIVYSLLPKEFTFSQLQGAYEVILGKKLDKRNFRKKIFTLNLLESTGKRKKIGRARPAELFSFKNRELKYVEIL